MAPVNPQQIFPLVPFDGQVFIDHYRIKWVYNKEDGTWTKVGFAVDLPLARGTEDPSGATNGLMSSTQKVVLDGTNAKIGGSGFIFNPATAAKSLGGMDLSNGLSSILTDNILLRSSTLDITLLNDVCASGKKIRFSIKDDLLDKLCVRSAGRRGPVGGMGPAGPNGRDGVGPDGPIGEAGENGQDATTSAVIKDIIVEDISDTIFDTAVVNLDIDQESATLEVTKSLMSVPASDTPASKVAATPSSVGISFNTQADPCVVNISATTTSALKVIKLPDGWNGGMQGSVPVELMDVSILVNSICAYYTALGNKIVDNWTAELLSDTRLKDKEGRGILASLAQQLVTDAWAAPIEFSATPAPRTLDDI